jgi:hypothetical protein
MWLADQETPNYVGIYWLRFLGETSARMYLVYIMQCNTVPVPSQEHVREDKLYAAQFWAQR